MSKTSKTGGGTPTGVTEETTAEKENKGAKAADTAKEKVVKPDTENAIRDAAAAVSGTAKHAAGVAKDQAGQARASAEEAIGTAREEAKTQGANIKQQAQARADEAKAKASEVQDEAKRRAHDEAENRKRQAAGAMSTTAQDLRKASEAVQENWMSKAFVTAAGQIEGVTSSIENKSPEELVDVARNAARTNPGLFLAGCFAAGVAISRTLKVAASRQPDHLYDDRGQGSRDRFTGQSGSYGQTGSYGQSGASGATGTSTGTSTSSEDLPDVGGRSSTDGQVGIGSGSGVTSGLGTSSDTTNR